MTDQEPSWIAHLDDLPEREGHYPPPFDGEKLSFERNLGTAAGSVTLGFRCERLPPGRRTGFTHAHSSEEELMYVLEGECLARTIAPGQPPEELPVRAGHVLAFPAGTGIAHTFVNRGARDCVVLVFGERREGDRVFYPDDPRYDAHLAATSPEQWWKRSGAGASAASEPKPWGVVHADDVPEDEGHYRAPFDAERQSFGRDLGKAAGTVKLGMWRERIPPGRRTSFTHAHSTEEELVYVLEGACVAHVVEPGQPPRDLPLRAGHAIAFPAGTEIAHTFANRGDQDCVVLAVGERREDDRVFYPEDTGYDAHLAATRPERWWKR